MSNFCSICGGSLATENVFCPACGAPATPTTPSTPPATDFIPVPAPPPVYTPAAVPVQSPPPPVQGGSAVKIILIVVGAFVLLGVLAAAVIGIGIWRVSKAVHVDKDGGVSVTTPTGTVTSGAGTSITPADLGVEIYPGAKRAEGGMNIKSSGASMTSAIYLTSDSMAQVVEFYKAQLGDKASTVETGNSTILTRNDEQAGEHKDSLLVTVTTSDSKTKINILHTKKH